MARHNRKHTQRKTAALPQTAAAHADPEKTEQLCRRIRTFLQTAPRHQLQQSELAGKCRSRRNPAAYQAALTKLRQEGVIRERRNAWVLCDDCFRAHTVRLSQSFGFIRDEAGTEHFVPGKFLLGSMPGDTVLARHITSRSGSPEAEVVSILEEAPDVRLTGTIVPAEEGLRLLPDTAAGTPLHIDYQESVPYRIGDKVLCVLTGRGRRHTEHRVKVVLTFGSADSAANCMLARIAELEIPSEFPPEVLQEARKAEENGITAFELAGRLDLRGEAVFTIDGAHSKDLDDAVSISRAADGGWQLGVHIADVSHYVRGGSPLDLEAFRRGTSIYYADRVIPMLPPALSNGICSLHPGEDRLAISALLHISPEGDLLETSFRKSVIRSAVRGIYTECNEILSGTAPAALLEKYAPVLPALCELDALTGKLTQLRRRRGAPELESTETALLVEDGICTGLAPVQRGRSECIIEACMLAANEAAARLAREQGFPLVYRVHEKPSPERIAVLRELLTRLGQEPPHAEEYAPSDIQRLLDTAREEPYFPAVNALTLRSMAKARYSEEPLGHYGLALHDYAHFTSPIRRYPDLAVHRILSDHLNGADQAWLHRRYGKFTADAAEQASQTEQRAVRFEREADACYAAEYMRAHVGERFRGTITGVTDFGVYIMLENMAEGLLHIRDLPEGEYAFEENWYLKNLTTGRCYRLGDPVTVTCTKAEVSTGRIDLAEDAASAQ